MAARMKSWKGKEISEAVAANMAKAIGEYALRVEGHSKRQLRKGHGVLTGTLRRSIHTAQDGYSWTGDHAEDGPERGGKFVEGVKKGKKITIQVGSGLVYAMAIHQGWPTGYKRMKGSFVGYHFITEGEKKAKSELPAIIAKYKLKK